jgi:hypothetical protein
MLPLPSSTAQKIESDGATPSLQRLSLFSSMDKDVEAFAQVHTIRVIQPHQKLSSPLQLQRGATSIAKIRSSFPRFAPDGKPTSVAMTLPQSSPRQAPTIINNNDKQRNSKLCGCC